MVKKNSRWILPALWGILLAVLSLMPAEQGNLLLFGIPHIDKIAHFGMYSVWTFLVYRAWSGTSKISKSRLMWLTFLLGTMTGAILEYAQYSMTVGRSFEISDMIANAVGSFAGVLAGKIWKPRER
ncbi:MAG TPA: VanZ family protein [Saprospiraceae bacterium]|nr:VanZ family protein [Saprospiraceae bacterium]